eukprot:Amastigsp_a516516_14.p6 type:complete len:158 gc:universal Amastigsp_a516516_14:603-1076(+)
MGGAKAGCDGLVRAALLGDQDARVPVRLVELRVHDCRRRGGALDAGALARVRSLRRPFCVPAREQRRGGRQGGQSAPTPRLSCNLLRLGHVVCVGLTEPRLYRPPRAVLRVVRLWRRVRVPARQAAALRVGTIRALQRVRDQVPWLPVGAQLYHLGH